MVIILVEIVIKLSYSKNFLVEKIRIMILIKS